MEIRSRIQRGSTGAARLILLLVLVPAGCSDPVSVDPPGRGEPPEVPAFSGVVSGPATDRYMAGLNASGMHPAGKGATLSGEAAIANAQVRVFELTAYVSSTDPAPVATATTDSAGVYSIGEYPAGGNLLVVVGDDPRLTAIILGAADSVPGDVNSATTLAAEYWGAVLAAGGSVSEAELQGTLAAAEAALEQQTAEELASLLDDLVPARFGAGFPDELPLPARQLVNALNGMVLATCDGLGFVEDSALPTRTLALTGFTEEIGAEPWAWVYDADAEAGVHARHPAYLARSAGGGATLLVPLHPGDPLHGGPALLEVISEDETMACPGLAFHIDPMDPAPGAFESAVDRVEADLVLRAEAFGYTADALLSTPVTDLESWVVPVAAGLKIIGGSDYPDNIRAVLAGTAPRLEGEPVSAEVSSLSDALWATSGMDGLLAEGGSASASVRTGHATAAAAGGLGRDLITLDCGVFPGAVQTPEELDCWMNVQNELEDHKDFMEPMYDRSGRVLSTLSGLPVQGIDEITSSMEQLTSLLRMIDDSHNALLPAELLELELEVSRTEFEEDATDTGTWAARIGATSTGWDLDVLLALSATPVGLGMGGAAIAKFRGQSDLVQQVVSGILDKVQDGMQKAQLFVVEFEPRVFGPVEIDAARDDRFFEWPLTVQSSESGRDPFDYAAPHRYRPRAAGVSELKVQTATSPLGASFDPFRGQHRESSDLLVVRPIQVALVDRGPIYLNPGDVTLLEAGVENAVDESIEWRVEDGLDGITVSPGGGDQHGAWVEALEPGRYQVRAESASRSGGRAENDPPRFDNAFVVVGALTVSPSPSCMQVGAAHQFTARIGTDTIDFNRLEWIIDGPGTLTPNGQFNATGNGDVTIVFSLKEDPDHNATVSFEVAEICRSFRLTSNEFDITGTCVTFFDDGIGGSGGVQFGSRISDDRHGQISFLMNFREFRETSGAEWTVTDPGWPWGSSVVPNLPGMVTPSFVFDYERFGPGSLVLTQTTRGGETVMEGSFQATHIWMEATADGVEERTSVVTGTFQGARNHRDDLCWLGS